MLSTSSFPKLQRGKNITFRIVQTVKVHLEKFNKDEFGMNTVEAIILLFVAAIVLLVFFTLIWPLIRSSVMEQLNNLFNEEGDRAPQQP